MLVGYRAILSFICVFTSFAQGFLRVLDDMDDICLDVPNAGQLLERLGAKCRVAGLITDEMVQKLPARGRKRFVSEGDGGRFKD